MSLFKEEQYALQGAPATNQHFIQPSRVSISIKTDDDLSVLAPVGSVIRVGRSEGIVRCIGKEDLVVFQPLNSSEVKADVPHVFLEGFDDPMPAVSCSSITSLSIDSQYYLLTRDIQFEGKRLTPGTLFVKLEAFLYDLESDFCTEVAESWSESLDDIGASLVPFLLRIKNRTHRVEFLLSEQYTLVDAPCPLSVILLEEQSFCDVNVIRYEDGFAIIWKNGMEKSVTMDCILPQSPNWLQDHLQKEFEGSFVRKLVRKRSTSQDVRTHLRGTLLASVKLPWEEEEQGIVVLLGKRLSSPKYHRLMAPLVQSLTQNHARVMTIPLSELQEEERQPSYAYQRADRPWPKSSNDNDLSQVSSVHSIKKSFEFLASRYYQYGCQIGRSEWKRQDYIFPFTTDESVLTLTDYYGDLYYDSLLKSPKTLSYQPCEMQNESRIKNKIDSLLKTIWKQRQSPKYECSLEIGFIKMFLTSNSNSTENTITVAELNRRRDSDNFNDRVNLRTIRVFLPDGPNALVSILEDLGAKLIEIEKDASSGTIQCRCFRENFKFNNRSFESHLELNPEDLSFADLPSYDHGEASLCMANPRSENAVDFACDLRIRAEAVATPKNPFKEKREKQSESPPSPPPPSLTEPGLNGMIQRVGDRFQCQPNTNISEILEKTNYTYHYFLMDELLVILKTVDGREFSFRRSGKCDLKFTYECWPKLQFLLKDEDDIPNLTNLINRCVLALFEASAEGRFQVQPWRCFGSVGEEEVSCANAQLLRQIDTNDKLEDMLGIKGKATRRALRHALEEVESSIKDLPIRVGDLDTEKLKDKLTTEAKNRGVIV